jgi:tetratricopeptide (TPR) repeat protein
VNGERISEHELAGEDRIRIGDVEMEFKAESSAYAQQERDFFVVKEEAVDVPEAIEQQPAQDLLAGVPRYEPAQHGGEVAMQPAAEPHAQPIPGIAGIGTPGKLGKNASLIEKFRALPPKRKAIMAIVMAALLYFGLFDDDEDAQPAKTAQTQKKDGKDQKGAKDQKGPRTFDLLSPEQKKFVESTHDLAFNYLRNNEYDKALFELDRLHAMVSEYKDSREMEKYARDRQAKQRAALEEKRRKEEEEKRKAKVLELIDRTGALMRGKKYDQVRELFAEILTLDPENTSVEKWRKEIQEYEEQERMKEQEKQIQAEINRRAWDVYREGLKLKNESKCREAIGIFGRVKEVNPSDGKVLAEAAAMTRACKESIQATLDPVLAEARSLETSGDTAKAYQLYEKATKIDPDHPGGYAGMNRIRGILHDRSKALYTEAILAESYSDFKLAKQKFQECMDVAPKDDIYRERAERKLARYFKQDSSPSGGAP